MSKDPAAWSLMVYWDDWISRFFIGWDALKSHLNPFQSISTKERTNSNINPCNPCNPCPNVPGMRDVNVVAIEERWSSFSATRYGCAVQFNRGPTQDPTHPIGVLRSGDKVGVFGCIGCIQTVCLIFDTSQKISKNHDFHILQTQHRILPYMHCKYQSVLGSTMFSATALHGLVSDSTVVGKA